MGDVVIQLSGLPLFQVGVIMFHRCDFPADRIVTAVPGKHVIYSECNFGVNPDG